MKEIADTCSRQYSDPFMLKDCQTYVKQTSIKLITIY